MTKLNKHFVSVIVPVFNDCERLKLCLKALQNQTYPKDSYEIIVVDNDSEEDIKSVVREFSQAHIAYESKPGSYAARNKGISLAKGEIIAFTDSDCIPAPDWLEKGVTNIVSVPNCGLVAGKIELFFKDPDQPTAVELYESITAFPQKKYVEKLRFGATANIFTFRSVIDTVGLFNAALKSSGDMEWGKRVFSANYKQVYVDDTVVVHPARASFSEMRNKIVRIVHGKFDLLDEKKYSFEKFIKILAYDFNFALKDVIRVVRNPNLKGIFSRFKVILVVLFRGYVIISSKLDVQIRRSFVEKGKQSV
jgi:glycosyltransferase involved in cell wall biosynthesis